MSRLLIYIILFLFNVSLTFASEVTSDKDLSINRNSAFQSSDALPFGEVSIGNSWLFRSDLSDEFNENEINIDKWFIAGDVNNEVIYPEESDLEDGSAADWVGRAPGAFDKKSPFIENGILNLPIKWDPNSDLFPYLDEHREELIDEDCMCKYEKYTTSGLISKSNAQYGYFEIKARAANIPISSAFWLIGNHFEVDIFELIGKTGNGIDGSGPEAPYTMPTTIHNWDEGDLEDNGYGKSFSLNWNVSEDFHVYGAEISSEYINFYADGSKVGSINKKESGKIWNTDFMHIWVDTEIFSWEGFPKENELPANFQIDYIRSWQLIKNT